MNLDILDARPVTLRSWQHLDLVLVGCGGTGSWLAPHLARLTWVLREGGRDVGLTFVDPDRVEHKNIARQHFCPAEVGLNKARTLATRYGQALGLDIGVVPHRFAPHHTVPAGNVVTLLIGCVDNTAARQALAAGLAQLNQAAERHTEPPRAWWLDCGNHAQSGQVLLGSASTPDALRAAFDPPTLCRALPSPTLQAPELLVPTAQETAAAALSCADLALLNAQSLSINAAVAAIAADYLVRLLLTGDCKRFATYVDTASGTQKSYYTSPARVAQTLGWPDFFAPPVAKPRRKKAPAAVAA